MIFFYHVLPQVQFPALDIRLSYNDIQLFFAIAKSIPTAGAPLSPDGAAAPDAEAAAAAAAAPRDSFRQKTEALVGV